MYSVSWYLQYAWGRAILFEVFALMLACSGNVLNIFSWHDRNWKKKEKVPHTEPKYFTSHQKGTSLKAENEVTSHEKKNMREVGIYGGIDFFFIPGSVAVGSVGAVKDAN